MSNGAYDCGIFVLSFFVILSVSIIHSFIPCAENDMSLPPAYYGRPM